MIYEQIEKCRPTFIPEFSSFVANDLQDTITIKEVWAFISLLLDIVLESLSLKFLSGNISSTTVNQHAEQILVGIGSSVKPLVNLYASICSSEIFSYLVGRTHSLNIEACDFSTISKILEDPGGLYTFYLIRDFVSEMFKRSDNLVLTILPDHSNRGGDDQ